MPLIQINDNLSENKSNLVKYKADWISEFICLTKTIPNQWYHTFQAQNSIKSVIKTNFIVTGKCIDPSQLSNKYFIMNILM